LKNIYEQKTDFTNENFPLGEYFLETFKTVPNMLFIEKQHSYKIKGWLEKNMVKIHEITVLLNDEVLPQTEYYKHEAILGHNGANLIVEVRYHHQGIVDFNLEDNTSQPPLKVDDMGVAVRCFYQRMETVQPFLDFLKTDSFEDKNKKSLSIITKDEFGFRLKEFKIEYDEKLDLDLHYGKNFIKVHKNTCEGLNKSKSGLVLLHGKPGTGKTTYIRNLINNLNKKVIFVPPFMVESLTSPEFIPFLMNHPDSILVIEDAEKVVSTRSSTSSNTGVSNILNLTDGLLSDCLNVKIIATFNMDTKDIDQALMRKGRLISEYRFCDLPIENVKRIFKKLKIDNKVTTPMSLADIYHHGVESYKIKNNPIGFKNN
tara:strand:+ start:12410 stop:13525 length:1116 start_codon:yes stop_codon:yes gene_type:complete